MSDSDIFISYSRRNKEFTQKLYNALIAADRTVWADWDSIPAASDWFAEIKDGIEQAEAIVFVLSPEWIKSGECRKELEHSVKMGKRLFPILYQTVDPNEVPQELAKINWVYMRDEDDFEKGFTTLNGAMDVDLDWVKSHTRLQVRAMEWDRKGRDAAFVLRGSDLTDGESFISSAAHKSPEPTELQGEYIIASRKDATRRQRRTMIGVLAALIVSVLLGIVALFQWSEAARHAFASRAGVLAALPYTTSDSHLDLASLLSVEAFRFDDSSNSRVSLLNAWQERPELRRYLHGHTQPVDAVTALSDGRFATTGDDGQLLIWDRDGNSLANLELGSAGLSLAASPDASMLAVGLDSGAIQLYNADDFSLIGTLEGHTYGVSALAFSRNGSLLASGAYDTNVIIWDVDSLTNEAVLPHYGAVYDVAWSPGGVLASTVWENGVYLWSGSGSSYELEYWEANDSVASVAWSPDGNLTTGEFKTIYVWDMFAGAPETPYDAHSTWVTDMAYSEDGTLASVSIDTNLKLWFPDGQTKSLTGHTGAINSVAWGSDGYLVTGSNDASAILWQVGGHPALHLKTDYTNWVQDVAWSPDGTLATADWDQIALWDANGNLLNTLTGHDDIIMTMDWSADGRLASSGFDQVVRVWNVDTGDSRELLGHESIVREVVWSSGGDLASLEENGRIIIWDLSTDQIYKTMDNGAYSERLIWLPDGRLANVTGSTVVFWDVASEQAVDTWTSPFEDQFSWLGNFTALNVSNDGTMLGAGDASGRIVIWDLETGEMLMTLTEHKGIMSKLEWSSTGKLASASEDWRVIVWDLDLQVPEYILKGHTDIAKSLAWYPDGRYLATGGHDSVTILWDTDPENWIAENCARAGRNLTEKEWEFYFPDEDYHQTCP